jgi:RNA polymerase sigma factor (sigma-70 family)
VASPRVSKQQRPSPSGREPSPNGNGSAGGEGDGFRAHRLKRRGAPPSLDANELDAVRVAVEEKLCHQYHQTDSFIEDKTDEMVAQAYIELAEAWKRGAQISSKVGWLITTAVRRSLDAARRDGREVYGEGAELLIANTEDHGPTTEAQALGVIEATEIYAAVEDLPDDQRQALSLYYWEGLTTRQGADAMELSNPMTFSRRRDAALDALREKFGIKPDDPIEKYLAVEIGFAAWACLMVNNSGSGFLTHCLDSAIATGESIRHGIAGIPGRVRELGSKVASSGSGESIGGAISNGTAGGAAKLIGGCFAAATLLYCGAAGVVGPGIGGGGHHDTEPPRVVRSAPKVGTATAHNTNPEPVHRAPAVPAPRDSGSRPTRGAGRGNTAQHSRDRQGHRFNRSARRQARESFTPQPAPEPEETAPPVEEPAPEGSYVGEPGGGGESAASSAAKEAFLP